MPNMQGFIYGREFTLLTKLEDTNRNQVPVPYQSWPRDAEYAGLHFPAGVHPPYQAGGYEQKSGTSHGREMPYMQGFIFWALNPTSYQALP